MATAAIGTPSPAAHVRRGPGPSRRAAVILPLLVVMALLAAACGQQQPDAPTTGPTPVEVPQDAGMGAEPDPAQDATAADQAATGDAPGGPAGSGTAAPDAGGPAGSSGDAGGEGTAPAGSTPGAAAPPPAPQPAAAAAPPPIDGPLGSLCRTYLRPDVPRLVIEVDAQSGAELSGAVLSHLRDTVAAVVDKPGGVELQAGGGIDGGAQPWTLESIRATAASTRDVAGTGDTAVLHVLSLRGEPDQSEPAAGQPDIRASIGVAFAAGEFVVFPDRVDSLAALLGGVDAVLRAVTVHEAGHLLCLVNIGYESEIDHEDPDHPGHSRDRSSVMFHAIETTAIGQLFSGPPPSTFAQADLADLDGLRTGRYQ